MEKISLEEVAQELGMQSKELIKRVQLFYKDIKSPKSKVSPEVAQEIFDIVMLNKQRTIPLQHTTYNCKNINLYFTSEKFDITMAEKIAEIYKRPIQNEYMIRSFNFDEHTIVKLMTAGLINLDIKKYIEQKSTKQELSNLLKNINKILDDVDFENIDGLNPLENFENDIQKHQPKEVYIEGVTYANFYKHKNLFEYIRELVKQGVRFEIGFVELSSDDEIRSIKEEVCQSSSKNILKVVI